VTNNYEAAWDRSRDRPPFANGTEGEGWIESWCNRCLVDAPFRNGISPTGCPLIAVALTGRTPAEWLDGPRDEHGRYSIAHKYTCVNFRRPGGGGGREPRPKPTPRGQLELFGRDEHEQRRMLTPLPDQTPDRAMA
jgi:hypothetical protein